MFVEMVYARLLIYVKIIYIKYIFYIMWLNKDIYIFTHILINMKVCVSNEVISINYTNTQNMSFKFFCYIIKVKVYFIKHILCLFLFKIIK